MSSRILTCRTGMAISSLVAQSPSVGKTASPILHRQSIQGLPTTRRFCAGAIPRLVRPTSGWRELSSASGKSKIFSSFSTNAISAADAGIAVAKNGSSSKPVAMWLFGTAGAVAVMVTVGGITRMTRSGLSMTDWKIQGSLPPSSHVSLFLVCVVL